MEGWRTQQSDTPCGTNFDFFVCPGKIEARTRVRAAGKLERQLEESERSRMELDLFVRLEWARTENESHFFFQCPPDHRSQYQHAV